MEIELKFFFIFVFFRETKVKITKIRINKRKLGNENKILHKNKIRSYE